MLVAAPTGSGKTLAFGIPLVARSRAPLSSLIITPTRELSTQIGREITRLLQGSKVTVAVLSTKTKEEIAQHPPHILVANPLSLVNLVTESQVRFSHCRLASSRSTM